ncbi:DNA-directed RNA polymerase specialized sigma24 family protein [Nonomuraea thailandensis]|uniref:DNA-directed RNA polymerase specialized sigma24 family protein n=1 Tax=Nonomuraea thailandensis TaxID=1188745 RepID=A0A9X2GK63_9ACTN|nr:sigma factor [Nonomuraea thailandensis]MCP2356058.1 DNA-directed RNA polymerase specialized sigma24 family protein [Nonomuraea thailandensis]
MDASPRTRLRDGDHAAFSALFDEFAQQIYAHAFRLAGDRSMAGDVTAATFGQAWHSRREIEPEGGSLRPWLLGIATNLVRSARRGERSRRRRRSGRPARDRPGPGGGRQSGRHDQVAPGQVAVLEFMVKGSGLTLEAGVSDRVSAGLTLADRPGV